MHAKPLFSIWIEFGPKALPGQEWDLKSYYFNKSNHKNHYFSLRKNNICTTNPLFLWSKFSSLCFMDLGLQLLAVGVWSVSKLSKETCRKKVVSTAPKDRQASAKAAELHMVWSNPKCNWFSINFGISIDIQLHDITLCKLNKNALIFQGEKALNLC